MEAVDYFFPGIQTEVNRLFLGLVRHCLQPASSVFSADSSPNFDNAHTSEEGSGTMRPTLILFLRTSY